jgi:hypothetical protein
MRATGRVGGPRPPPPGDPAVLLEPVLQIGRRDVLSAGGDDDVLLATGDVEEAVLVDPAQVAGVEPAVDEDLGRRAVFLAVAAEDVRAADEHLAVLGDPCLHPLDRLPDRPEAEFVQPVRGRRSRGLVMPHPSITGTPQA